MSLFCLDFKHETKKSTEEIEITEKENQMKISFISNVRLISQKNQEGAEEEAIEM